jgi:hypothetical protein
MAGMSVLALAGIRLFSIDLLNAVIMFVTLAHHEDVRDHHDCDDADDQPL